MVDVRDCAGVPLLLLDRSRSLVVVGRPAEAGDIRYVTMAGSDWTLLPHWKGPHPFAAEPRRGLFRRRTADAEAWRWLLPHLSPGR